MPRGAKGQRDLMAQIIEASKANPGISAEDLAKMMEKKLIEEGVVKPSAELPDDLKADAAKIQAWCETNKKKVMITKEGLVVKSVRPPDPNKPKAAKKAKK